MQVEVPGGRPPATRPRPADPAECVTQTASATQNPSTSPSLALCSGMPSAVNENRPLIASSTLASRRAGSSAWASAQAGREVLLGERQHRGHHLGLVDAADLARRHRHGRCPQEPMPSPSTLRGVEVGALVPQDRRSSRSFPASSGSGPESRRAGGPAASAAGHAHHRGDRRAPYARTPDDDVARSHPARWRPRSPARLRLDFPMHLGAGRHTSRRARAARRAAPRRRGRLGDAVGGDVQPAEHVRRGRAAGAAPAHSPARPPGSRRPTTSPSRAAGGARRAAPAWWPPPARRPAGSTAPRPAPAPSFSTV